MKASIDAIAGLFPDYIADTMKINPFDTVADIVTHVGRALKFGVRYKDVLSRTAVERYDWSSVGRTFVEELATMSFKHKSRTPVASV
jgi:hypothetical protein